MSKKTSRTNGASATTTTTNPAPTGPAADPIRSHPTRIKDSDHRLAIRVAAKHTSETGVPMTYSDLVVVLVRREAEALGIAAPATSPAADVTGEAVAS